jgi:ABC-type nitrate/sulfonate/bicarbonate transport system permease component
MKRTHWFDHAVKTSFVLAMAAAWYVATSRTWISPLFLPAPKDVLTSLQEIVRAPEFADHLLTTALSTLAAFGLALFAGLGLGMIVARNRLAFDVIEPLLSNVFAIPLIIFYPLCVLVFGIGPASKIAFAAVYGSFPIALNTMAGFHHVERKFVVYSETLGASRLRMFRRVLLPGALPQIAAGLRVGFVITFASVIAGEMIASLSGIGHEITYHSEIMEPGRMFAWILLAIALTVMVNALLSSITRVERPT